MANRNRWSDLKKRSLALADHCQPGFDVAILNGDMKGKTKWTIDLSHHVLLICLGDDLGLATLSPETGRSQTLASTLRSGAIGILPAGPTLELEAKGGLIRLCQIFVPVTDRDIGQIDLDAVWGMHDMFLHEAAKALERTLIDGQGRAPTSLRALASALYWHIIDRYDRRRHQEQMPLPALSFRTKDILVTFIRENLMEPITIETLAALSGQTVQVLLRQFYAEFGTTPAQYIARARIEQAKSLLSLSRFAVDDIAARCGFDNSLYFNASFVKHVGMAPLSYRQAVR